MSFKHGEVVLVTEYYTRPEHMRQDGTIVPEKHLSRILKGTIGSTPVVNGLYDIHLNVNNYSRNHRWKRFFEYEISKW